MTAHLQGAKAFLMTVFKVRRPFQFSATVPVSDDEEAATVPKN